MQPSLCSWPADYHIVGKDILRFHTIYWPAFLMAAEIPLPKHILVHAHWTINRQKMSKSIGNIVSPHKAIATYGLDPLRYFLLREGGLVDDGDYSDEMVISKLNNDLADTLGNLLSRLTSTSINPSATVPECAETNEQDRAFIDKIKALSG